MKIGILTYHSVNNFGANLQALSTYSILKAKGHSPIFIDWVPNDLLESYATKTPLIQAGCHKQFVDQYLSCTERCATTAEVCAVIRSHKIESIVIGSDAVLQDSPLRERFVLSRKSLVKYLKPTSDRVYPNPFWGAFNNNLEMPIPTAIMSASSQNSDYKHFMLHKRNSMCKSLIQMKYISVRDTWTQNMVTYLSKGTIHPEVTPDPVFAFNQNVQSQITEIDIRSKYDINSEYILLSLHHTEGIPPAWFQQLNEAVVNSGKILLTLPMPKSELNIGYGKQLHHPISPLEWYSLIKYSSGYIGHNMHPIIVSLHNAVPFFSLDHYGVTSTNNEEVLQSSKIFHIIKSAGFTSNFQSIKNDKSNIPAPNIIIQKLNEFNREQCAEFARSQTAAYNRMIDNILVKLQSAVK